MWGLRVRVWLAALVALAACVAAAVTSGGATAAVPTPYLIVNLGTLGGPTSQAEALNDEGDVVGFSALSNGNTHAFLYRSGTMRDLGTLGGANSRAYDVNERGVVVGAADGDATTACAGGAFLFDGQMHQLNAHPAELPSQGAGCFESKAFGINDRGDVVGYYWDSYQSDVRAWALIDGKSYICCAALANDINNSGTAAVVEGYADTTAYVGDTPWGTRWKELTFDGRARWGAAEAINEQGWVVGATDHLGEQVHAFLFRNDTMTDLGTLDGEISHAYGLNEAGDVVGTSGSRAFLWTDGRMIDLNTLVPESSGWTLDTAYDINNRGQIVGVGSLNGQKRAFLLNPPAVATLTATPSTVERAGNITVSWQTGSPRSLDWIGLYKSGAPDTPVTNWFYTSTCVRSAGTAKASGSCSLRMPTTAATYELRLFKNGGYTRLATFGPITVTAPVTLSATPTTVTASGSLTATWQGVLSPTSKDWIGLYKSEAGDTAFTKWFYTSTCTGSAGTAKTSGSCTLTMPAVPGTYELRLFTNNGYTRLATSAPITVTAPATSGATLTATPTTVTAGGSLTAAWQGVATPKNTDWIGLYKSAAPDDAFVNWFYTSSCTLAPGTAKASGSCSLKLPTTAGGYELRLFKNGSYTRLATSGPVTVTAATASS